MSDPDLETAIARRLGNIRHKAQGIKANMADPPPMYLRDDRWLDPKVAGLASIVAWTDELIELFQVVTEAEEARREEADRADRFRPTGG